MSSIINKRGFTLVELLAVILIMVTIIAAALPALKALSSTGLSAGARQFSNTMLLARQYAVNKRTCVRVALAVDLLITNSVGTVGSNYVCTAYSVYWGSNYVGGAYKAWWPLQDWRQLPAGVVFTDHNTDSSTGTHYDPTIAPPALAGGSTPRTFGGGTYLQRFDNGNSTYTMPVITNINSGATYNLPVSYIEWRPTGVATYNGVAAVRLAQGALLAAGSPSTGFNDNLLISDVNNWVYVEYDGYSGRVRIRYPESYQ